MDAIQENLIEDGGRYLVFDKLVLGIISHFYG